MGVLYFVFPVDDKARAALPDLGVDDAPPEDGRNPTPTEIRAVLGALQGFRCTYTEEPVIGSMWQATVEDAHDPERGAWTLINVSKYPGETQQAELWFEKGWPDLMLQIMVGLAGICGPLFIFPDTGGAALVVRRGDDPAALYESWQHTNPDQGINDDSE